jgi:hypothetical protein
MHIGRPRSSAGGRNGGGGALRQRAAAQGGRLAGAKSISRYNARFGQRFALERRTRHGEVIRRSAVHRNAAEATRIATGRRRAAVRRRRAGRGGLGNGNNLKSHRQLSYLATEARRRRLDDGRRRRPGSTAAAARDGGGAEQLGFWRRGVRSGGW